MDFRKLDRKRLGVLGASMAGNCVNGLVAGTVLSVVLVPLSQDFGWPRAVITGVGALLAPLNIFLPLAMGWLADRFGARTILLIGNICFALSLSLASVLPPNVYLFYATFIAISIFGHVTGPLLFGKILSGWFDEGRGAAIGLVAGVGNGLCNIAFPIIAALLLANFGWRGTYSGISMLVFAIGFPAMYFFLRDPPKTNRAATEDGANTGTISVNPETGKADFTLQQALRTPTYWALATAMTLGSGCMLSVLSHTVPELTDRGFPLSQAVPVVSCISLVGMLAQIGVGALLDKVRRPWVAAPLYGASVLGIYFILNGTSLPLLLLGGALLGLGVGAEFAILPLLLSRYFGVTNYGKIAGATYSGIMLAGGLFPFLLDYTFDRTGSYTIGFQAMQVALCFGAILIATLPLITQGGLARHSNSKTSPAPTGATDTL